MSGYRVKHTGSITFDGKKIGYELKRLTVAESLDARKLDAVQMDEYTRKNLLRLDRIDDADGNEVSLDTVFADFYFSPLVSELSLALFETGQIPKAKADPFDGSLSAASTDTRSQQA